MRPRFLSTLLAALVLVSMPVASLAWRFASIADSRGDYNGVNTPELTTIVNRINQEGVDLVIFQGDAVNGSSSDATTSSQMDTWLGVMNTLNCPWYYTPGNHEVATSTVQENVLRAKVDMPTNGPAGDLEMVYSFEHENAHFVALNSWHYGQSHHVQRSWLATDLRANSKLHVFVMTHDPGYPSGPHATDSLNYYLAERDELWSIMGVYGVRMFFCGHEHLYQRSMHGGITQVINGSCGAPLHTGYPDTIAQYHYVIVTVDGSSVSGVCKDDTGAVLDSWSYTVPPLTIADCRSARTLPDGSYVRITDKVVTCTAGPAIYIEEDDRSAAFRVTGASGIAVGDRVTVAGTIATNPWGEREIQGSVLKLSSGNPVPKPLGMTNRALLGGPIGYNPGANGAFGCNNSCLLVKTFGKVTKVGSGPDTGSFYIDDGSGLVDGTWWDGTLNAGVKVWWGGPVQVGEYCTLTGISSSFRNGPDLCRLLLCTDPIVLDTWTAYNDCCYSISNGHPPLQPNVTTINIGANSPGPPVGGLVDFATGIPTGVTATLTQSGGVIWQPDAVTGGSDCNPGTDAYGTFSPSTASLKGVIYYGSTGWYVDLAFTGLNPSKLYEFATSANRNEATYTDRLSRYTISGADAFTNASTAGVTVGDGGASSSFNTGYNTLTGYAARWTAINPGADGSFTVRAEAGSSQVKAYAFSAFMLKQLP